MAAVSGQWALAVVPGRSILVALLIHMNIIFLKLVPDGFYIHLFTTKELEDTAERAGLNVIGISSTRILGIIPYTGIRFSDERKARIKRYDGIHAEYDLTLITPMYNEADGIQRLICAISLKH